MVVERGRVDVDKFVVREFNFVKCVGIWFWIWGNEFSYLGGLGWSGFILLGNFFRRDVWEKY